MSVRKQIKIYDVIDDAPDIFFGFLASAFTAPFALESSLCVDTGLNC